MINKNTINDLEQVVVLSNKDKVRNMINLYHGSSENHINIIKELIGNSLDIFKKLNSLKEQNEIKIILHDLNKIEFIDNASGIPVEKIASDGRPNYEAIFERDCAGTNYGKNVDTIGQHGVFLYTLTMTSEDIEYYISRPNNNVYTIKYHKGDRVENLKKIDTCENTYTRMIFSLDKEVWSNPNFPFEEVCEIAKSQSALSKTKITIIDKKHNLSKIFNYKNGYEDLFKEMTSHKNIICNNVEINKNIQYDFFKKGTNNTTTDNMSINMIFNYSNDNNEDYQKEFLNTADLLLHGTIQEGIYQGLKNSIDKWLVEHNKYNKNEKHININDISTGLNYICDVSSLYVEYDNQTKQKTSVKRYKPIIKDIIEEFMEVLFIENPITSEKICTQVLVNSRVQEQADKARKEAKKKNKNVYTSKPKIDKLTDATSKNRMECEIFLTEGDSAGGNAKQCRNRRTQGILSQRGKSTNVDKSSSKSQELKNIEIALGCGTGKKFNIEKLRYGKIILLADGDSDGAGHIVPLWLTYFYRNMKELIKQGYIYIAMPPLYKNNLNNKKIKYTYSEEEQELFLQKNKPISIQRYKGLGEMDSNQLWETTMNPETRKLIQVQILDDEETDSTFTLLMGKRVEPRFNFIMNNAQFVKNIDI